MTVPVKIEGEAEYNQAENVEIVKFNNTQPVKQGEKNPVQYQCRQINVLGSIEKPILFMADPGVTKSSMLR